MVMHSTELMILEKKYIEKPLWMEREQVQ